MRMRRNGAEGLISTRPRSALYRVCTPSGSSRGLVGRAKRYRPYLAVRAA
jgi:hypothetical protein